MGNCFQRLISRTPNPVANPTKSAISSALVSSPENQLLSQPHHSELSSNVSAPPSSLFTVDTWAGDGIVGTRDGTGKECSINWPYEIKFDASGNGFFTAYGSASVRKITPNGKVTTISDRLSETGETFHCVRGLALDKKGNIFIADTGNNAIRKINAETGFCETIVTDMVLSSPYGITVADDGMIYISDTYADRILAIQPEDGHCQVVAGTVNGYLDGNGKTEARFNLPQGIIMDPAGNLIVADSKNNAIRKINLKKDGQVTTVATGFQSPYGVAMDKKGNIFVSDYGNSAIQVVDLYGKVRPVAGELYSNYSDYPKSLKMPTGIDIDSYGNIVICDCYNHVIRRVNCVFAQMADVWPKSHRYLPREVSRATEELHCILAKSPPVPLPKELILIMLKNLIEVWPIP